MHGLEMKAAMELQDSPSQRRSAEEVVADAVTSGRSGEEAEMSGDSVHMGAEKANVKSHTSVQRTVTLGMARSVIASSKPPSQPQPKTADTSEPKKIACPMYLCDGCDNLMFQNNVMVWSKKQTAPASKPRVLCKACFIQKTGIICIG